MTRLWPVVSIVVAVALGAYAVTRPTDSVPLIDVPQGVSAHRLRGGRVLLLREGLPVTAFLTESGHRGARAQWCPRERLFWAPKTDDLWSHSGKYAYGPVERDMRRAPVTITADFQARVNFDGEQHPRRSNGRKEIRPELFDFFQRFLSYRSGVPLPTKPVFCPDPVK